MTVSIDVVQDFGKLREIEDTWNALIKKYGRNPFFLTRFVEQFMEFYRSKDWTPLTLVISNDEVITGIAPMMTRKRFGVRTVRFLSEFAFSPDFVFDDQYRESYIASILDFLFKTLRCQFVDLTLPAESPNLRILEQMCKAKRIHFWENPCMGHCIIPIQCTWDEFKKRRGYNFRRRLKRLERKLDRAGSWRTVCIGKRNNRSDAIKRILDVERKSWKQAWRAQRGIKMDQDLLMIWKASQYTARTEPNFDWKVWFLELNGQTLAYTLVLQYKETAYIVKTSFDEEYRKFQPSIYINNAAIRELFEEGQARHIDWLSDLPFHRNWTEISMPRVEVMMSRSGVIRTITEFVLPNVPARTRVILDQLLKGLS